MKLKIAAYGIARDILGNSHIEYEVSEGTKSTELLDQLKAEFPQLKELNSLLVAINADYAAPDQVIVENDEVVLIPPVSGG